MPKILFAGGGTMGPVTPLLAVARRMRAMRRDVTFAWAGTAEGPERDVVERERIPFFVIPTAKFPRYLSLDLLRWPWRYRAALRAARETLDRERPDVVVGAGGFTQVPIIREAARRGIPCAIHQLDQDVGLSNRLVARACRSVTTSFSYQTPPFFGVRATQVATPCRFVGASIPDRHAAAERFYLEPERPTVFVLGGGTGALALNGAMLRIKDAFLRPVQVIHATGKGKMGASQPGPRYVAKEFFDEADTLFAYAAADVVVSRAGMGTLSELATLNKAAVVVPIPDSHQVANAERIRDGAVIVQQDAGLDTELRRVIEEILADPSRQAQLGARLHALLPTDDGTELAKRWLQLVEERYERAP